MHFGLFYQQQFPKPWSAEVESRNFRNHIEQIVMAEQLGFHSVWVTEHHYLEEYSHSSAPDVFLGAVAARTSRIRLGHGIRHTPPRTNIPARLAESAATLDLISGGRLEFGIGEGATKIELGAHNVPSKEKRAMGLEAAEQVANMMVMSPYPGWRSEYFEIACRNVVPKPLQKPHPPMWMACTNRETIAVAARHGLGALAFAFVDPHEAKQWVDMYYDLIRSEECTPLAHSVNARFALVSPLSVAPTREQAIREGYHCFNFFKSALLGTLVNGSVPGHTTLWDDYMAQQQGDTKMEETIREAQRAGDSYLGTEGTSADVARRLEIFAQSGVDDLLFIVQGGGRTHEQVCSTLRNFASGVMPHFSADASLRRQQREAELAPFIAAAMKRKKFMPALAKDEVPVIPPARIMDSIKKL